MCMRPYVLLAKTFYWFIRCNVGGWVSVSVSLCVVSHFFSAPHGWQWTVTCYEYLFPFSTPRRRSGLCKLNFTCAHTHERTRVCARTHTHHVSVRVCVCVCVQPRTLLWFRQPDDLLPVLPRIDDDVRTCWTLFQHGLHGTLSCHGDIYGGTRTDGLGGPIVLEDDYIPHTYNPHTYHIKTKVFFWVVNLLLDWTTLIFDCQ